MIAFSMSSTMADLEDLPINDLEKRSRGNRLIVMTDIISASPKMIDGGLDDDLMKQSKDRNSSNP